MYMVMEVITNPASSSSHRDNIKVTMRKKETGEEIKSLKGRNMYFPLKDHVIFIWKSYVIQSVL